MGERVLKIDECKGLDIDAKLDLAEELFVACKFDDAATICNSGLNLFRCPRPAPLVDAAPSLPLVDFGNSTIAPLGASDSADFFISILLQCGFELRRSEDWARCRSFYDIRGPVPFHVAILWLRLQLASGEVAFVREVLLQLCDVLGGASSSGLVLSGGTDYTLSHSSNAALNYAEVMEMLTTQVMLPSGEYVEALALVKGDTRLDSELRATLLKACESSVASEDPKGKDGDTSLQTLSSRSIRSPLSGQDPNDGGQPNSGRQRLGNMVERLLDILRSTPEAKLSLFITVGAVSLGAYVAYRRRHSLWGTARHASRYTSRVAEDFGSFLIGST